MRFVPAVTDCRRQRKIFASGVNFSIFNYFLFLSLKLFKLGEVGGVKVLASKSGSVKLSTNLMSEEAVVLFSFLCGAFCFSYMVQGF